MFEKMVYARWLSLALIFAALVTIGSMGTMDSMEHQVILRQPIPHEIHEDKDIHKSMVRAMVSTAASINQQQIVHSKVNLSEERKDLPPKDTSPKNMLSTLLGTDSLDLQTIEVVATGYYAGPESTGKTKGHPEYGITYSGIKVRRDLVSTVAADPKIFPIGSLLHIPGYGYGIVADTGSAIKGNIIDLYFETKDDVYDKWGKKKVKILMIKKGNGKVTEQMVNQLNEKLAMYRNPPNIM